MTICLTYDGSVNGDWIAHYAVALAAADAASSRRLRVLHVETTDISGPPLAAKFDNIRRLCARAGIEAEIEILPMRDGVFGGLRAALPGDPETLVVCGLRAKGGRRGFLHGTVSERLLNAGQGTVVALRVVQPGLLGVVRRLLLPVAGKLPGRRSGHRLLNLLAQGLSDLHLLHVVEVSTAAFRRLDAERAGALRHAGQAHLDREAAEITAGIDLAHVRRDAAVKVSDDWVREVLIDAARLRADLIALEAPRASLARRITFGDPLEVILRDAPCDVAVYRGPDGGEGAL